MNKMGSNFLAAAKTFCSVQELFSNTIFIFLWTKKVSSWQMDGAFDRKVTFSQKMQYKKEKLAYIALTFLLILDHLREKVGVCAQVLSPLVKGDPKMFCSII